MSLQSRYYQFHGRNPRSKKRIDFDVPTKGLVRLGKAIAIEYECDKWHGGGDGKKAVYRHEFETPCFLYMDNTGRRQLYIIGERLKVTEAGIEN